MTGTGGGPRKGAGRPATGRTRKGTSVSLSPAERERLARWGETVSAAVRRVLAVAEAAEQRGDATPPTRWASTGPSCVPPEEEGARLLAAWKGTHA